MNNDAVNGSFRDMTEQGEGLQRWLYSARAKRGDYDRIGRRLIAIFQKSCNPEIKAAIAAIMIDAGVEWFERLVAVQDHGASILIADADVCASLIPANDRRFLQPSIV